MKPAPTAAMILGNLPSHRRYDAGMRILSVAECLVATTSRRRTVAARHTEPRLIGLLALTSIALATACASTSAQVTPERRYYPINRPAPFVVVRPPEASGELRIDLLKFGIAKPVASAAVEEGRVDLGALFPMLWGAPSPEVLYAQLVAGDTPVGAPSVLQPMVNPARAMVYDRGQGKPYYLDPLTKQASIDVRTADVIFQPQTAAYSGIRAWTDQHVIFNTSLGEIEFRLRPDHAPNTVRNFLDLVEGGFYQDIIFHRIVPRLPSGAPVVLQVGDPTGSGDGGPGYAIDLEPSKLAHTFGVLSMARDNDPDTNGSQVFIALSRQGTQYLDGKYTSFGEAVAGASVIADLEAVPVKGQTPIDPPILHTVRAKPAPPMGTGPEAAVRPSTTDTSVAPPR
jgi:peptidyl-prolyl cis-trans isomerase B (cyclophilin B)